eukprot:1157493-Pelagomonas_calceolata.AAC.1
MVPADMRVAAPDKPFLFAVDHCFPFKGQGTVMTGTVLQVCVWFRGVRGEARDVCAWGSALGKGFR